MAKGKVEFGKIQRVPNPPNKPVSRAVASASSKTKTAAGSVRRREAGMQKGSPISKFRRA